MARDNQVQTTNNAPAIQNPFKSPAESKSAGTAVEAHKAQIEMMMRFRVAKEFPRELHAVANKAIKECQSPALAEVAEYSYIKGGTEISGPSIRLLEALARCMGNIESGWEVIDTTPERSNLRAFAIDLENNTIAAIKFSVKHWRDTKGGGYALKDERDIYEMCANQAQRRVRGCLEKLMPKELVDMAVAQCDKTAEASVDASHEGLTKLLAAFNRLGINRAMIEAKFQGKKLETLKPRQLLALRKNWTAINDGMAKIADFFDVKLQTNKDDAPPAQEKGPDLKAAVTEKKAEDAATPPPATDEGDKLPEPEQSEQSEKPDLMTLENRVRDFAKKVTSHDALAEGLANDYADDLAAIKEGAAGSYATLKTYLDQRLIDLKGE